MKKYRIKSVVLNGSIYYTVQERTWFIWRDITNMYCVSTIEQAEKFLKKIY